MSTSVDGFKYLLVVVDRTTRYVDAVPMSEASTQACADALLDVRFLLGTVRSPLTTSACSFPGGCETTMALMWRDPEKNCEE